MEYITLHTKHTTYQMGISDYGFLLHLYYGPKTQDNMEWLLTRYDRGFSGNPYEAGNDRTFSMDIFPQEYPCYGNGDFRSPAFNVRNKNGVFGADLRYCSHRFVWGKYSIPGLPAVYSETERDGKVLEEKEIQELYTVDTAYTCEVYLEDEMMGLEVCLKYGVLPEQDVITRSVSVKNTGSETIYLNKVYSTVLDFLTGDFELIHFHGRHAMERMEERIPVIYGNQNFLCTGSCHGIFCKWSDRIISYLS